MSTKNIFSAFIKTFRRELKRFRKDPLYIIGSVVVMTFCFVFFLTLFEEGQPEKMPVAVVDLDNSSLSRQYIRNVDATQQVDIIMHLNNYTEARKEMQKGNIYAFIIIDHHFASDVYANRQPTITFYVNDAYLIAGSLILKDITYMTELTNGAAKQKVWLAKGMEDSRIMGIIQPITLDTHLIGNPWANYGIYLLNVLLPGVLQIMVLMLTIYSIGTELKYKTSKTWLLTADNSMLAALTGKLMPQTIIFTLMGMISNVLLFRFMHYPLNTAIAWMFLATFLFVVAYQAIGILLIGITPLLRDGVTLSAFYGLLGFTFAGFTFPIEQLPYPFRIFSGMFPIRHYFEIYVNQALNGLPVQYSISQFLYLLVFALIPVMIFTRLKKAALYQNYPIK
jgi:ABC-2 type transport system permease protein